MINCRSDTNCKCEFEIQVPLLETIFDGRFRWTDGWNVSVVVVI